MFRNRQNKNKKKNINRSSESSEQVENKQLDDTQKYIKQENEKIRSELNSLKIKIDEYFSELDKKQEIFDISLKNLHYKIEYLYDKKREENT